MTLTTRFNVLIFFFILLIQKHETISLTCISLLEGLGTFHKIAKACHLSFKNAFYTIENLNSKLLVYIFLYYISLLIFKLVRFDVDFGSH